MKKNADSCRYFVLLHTIIIIIINIDNININKINIIISRSTKKSLFSPKSFPRHKNLKHRNGVYAKHRQVLMNAKKSRQRKILVKWEKNFPTENIDTPKPLCPKKVSDTRIFRKHWRVPLQNIRVLPEKKWLVKYHGTPVSNSFSVPKNFRNTLKATSRIFYWPTKNFYIFSWYHFLWFTKNLAQDK